ncbi:MAG TPA: nucleotide sugar dehydrogenase [Dehalococcoidia bacterium]|nr:nucleotide sugar dehydrogenase [Dehalococcoidia bacterium]
MTRVAVVGLGKIGLPLAALFAGRGAQVTGCDIDPEVVEAVSRGESPVKGEPGLDEAVRLAHAAGNLRATANTAAAVAESDVVVVVVRAGIDSAGRPNYRQLDAAAGAIAHGLRRGTLVLLETTVPVGTTRHHFGRLLRGGSGLGEGDFHLAYSPERVSSGSVFRDLATYPKLVGGVDAASGAAAKRFYSSMLEAEVLLLPDAETAEFTKLAESVYRDVNIALANELARAAEQLGVDFAVASAAANSQPYSHLHDPGLGVGGHCIPVYPYFLMQAADLPLVSMARETNDSMAEHGVGRLAEALEDGLAGRTVLILGLAYRGGVKEAELSSTLLVAEALRRRDARVLVHDPLFSASEVRALGLEPATLPPSVAVDAIVLQAGHPEYAGIDFRSFRGCAAVLDGRRFFDPAAVEAAGLRYLAIGKP